ncbi:MAG TPA: hypothetical protein VFR58_16165 [Flavisolibacter sp.]|nr:hypothetical protein [Flavisolibacter sp.]
MKKLFLYLMGLALLSLNVAKAQNCSGVSIQVYGPIPQMGSHNYFGVRATIAEPSQNDDITITGSLREDGGGGTSQPFTLIIPKGETTAETGTFFQTCPACNAEVTVSSVTPCPNNEIVINYAGVDITFEVNANILRFNSQADFNTVLDHLDALYESHNDTYDNAQDPNLTEDQLDALDLQNGFDEFEPFRYFESLFQGFSSKRAELETLENSWLVSNFTAMDPDDADLTFDDAANTIFNSSYSFKIGSDVYTLASDGVYLNGDLQAHLGKPIRQVTGGRQPMLTDYALYVTRLAGDLALGNSNMLGPVCKSNKKDKKPFESGNDRYKLKVAINSWLIRSGAKGKVVHYELKNGSWKRARAKMAVFCGGRVYNNQCSESFLFSDRNPTSGWKKRKQLKVARHQAGVIWRTYTNMLSASFDTQAGHSASLALIF